MDISYCLGSGYYLTSNNFNGNRVVNIRYYREENGRTFPTKKGVCLTPMRFAALVDFLDDADKAYEFVSTRQGEWRTVHVGGQLFISVTNGYGCINVRYFYKADDGKVLPTKQGVSLALPVWRELKKWAVELKERDPILKLAERCGWGDLMHQNQTGFVECGECNPFYDYMQPAVGPPVYSELLLMDPVLFSTPTTAVAPPAIERTRKKRKLQACDCLL
jgi:hypothetical protein